MMAEHGPFDAWLVQGGRTLHLRMAAHSANALHIARAQEAPQVTRVEYPGLESIPVMAWPEDPRRGDSGYAELRAKGAKNRERFVDALGLVDLVPSLASTSTIVSYPAKTSHRSLSEDQRAAAGIWEFCFPRASSPWSRLEISFEPWILAGKGKRGRKRPVKSGAGHLHNDRPPTFAVAEAR